MLPVEFFTIVLNGEPFIRYHEQVFSRLRLPWRWHIIEGVAALKHDTAWSVAAGGHVADNLHDHGRSNDGTSAYLDDLVARFPDKIVLYRKPLGEFWDGKREMVNAPLPNLGQDCILWQIDADELWTLEQIETVHRLFHENPDRTAAYYWCWYYVGPRKIISTRYNYAQNPNQEWLRTWRYMPGATWAAHEPPILVTPRSAGMESVNIAAIKPFEHDEMEQHGVVFHHFAYATEAQLDFKELYYGYKDARAQWNAMQQMRGSHRLRNYLAWVPDNALFDDVSTYLVEPLARQDASGRWHFDGRGMLPLEERRNASKRPRIVVDGIFWQYISSGIARVWENLLREWAATEFSDNVIVLDRAGTAPRIPGVHYWTIARHNYSQTGRDSLYLEWICRLLDADLFISTYYTAPTLTPSFFLGYDMIPEVLGLPLLDETWKEKRRAILHASGHAMISRNSATDLETVYPELPRGATHVMYVAAAPEFSTPSADEVAAFRVAHGLENKTYVIMVGERLGYGGYKNGSLAFRALALVPPECKLALVCVGGHQDIEPELRAFAPNIEILRLALSDGDLRAAYAGSHALLYPSRYEGFGMPPLEAMACGTPVIVCRNSSIPEVVGEAGIFAEDDPASFSAAIMKLFDPVVRAEAISLGREQAARFSFARMAREMSTALTDLAGALEDGAAKWPTSIWDELRRFQNDCQSAARDLEEAPLRSMKNYGQSTARDLKEALEALRSMKNSPFWKARDFAVKTMKVLGLRARH